LSRNNAASNQLRCLLRPTDGAVFQKGIFLPVTGGYIKTRAYSNATLYQNFKAIGEELSEM
jgi:hypothetical protein